MSFFNIYDDLEKSQDFLPTDYINYYNPLDFLDIIKRTQYNHMIIKLYELIIEKNILENNNMPTNSIKELLIVTRDTITSILLTLYVDKIPTKYEYKKLLRILYPDNQIFTMMMSSFTHIISKNEKKPIINPPPGLDPPITKSYIRNLKKAMYKASNTDNI
jgi:hypothetical protein